MFNHSVIKTDIQQNNHLAPFHNALTKLVNLSKRLSYLYTLFCELCLHTFKFSLFFSLWLHVIRMLSIASNRVACVRRMLWGFGISFVLCSKFRSSFVKDLRSLEYVWQDLMKSVNIWITIQLGRQRSLLRFIESMNYHCLSYMRAYCERLRIMLCNWRNCPLYTLLAPTRKEGSWTGGPEPSEKQVTLQHIWINVIWYYQLSWKRKLATAKSFKADVSSVSPSFFVTLLRWPI